MQIKTTEKSKCYKISRLFCLCENELTLKNKKGRDLYICPFCKKKFTSNKIFPSIEIKDV